MDTRTIGSLEVSVVGLGCNNFGMRVGRKETKAVVDGVPIESHTATISVEADGDGSKVTWAYDVTPDEMAPIFGDTYKGALASLENSFR